MTAARTIAAPDRMAWSGSGARRAATRRKPAREETRVPRLPRQHRRPRRPPECRGAQGPSAQVASRDAEQQGQHELEPADRPAGRRQGPSRRSPRPTMIANSARKTSQSRLNSSHSSGNRKASQWKPSLTRMARSSPCREPRRRPFRQVNDVNGHWSGLEFCRLRAVVQSAPLVEGTRPASRGSSATCRTQGPRQPLETALRDVMAVLAV